MQCIDCLNRPAATPDGRCRVCSVAEAQTAMEEARAVAVSPPGSHPAASRWMFRPLGGLATALTVLLSVCIAVDLLSLVAGFRIRVLMADVREAGRNEIDAADALYGATGLLQWLALLATAAVFIIWFHRTRENAELFNALDLRHSAGWAVGAWFIPFANLWIPKKIANDVWQASAPPPDYGSRQPAGVGFVTAWWAVWVTNLLFERLASQVYLAADRPEDIKAAVGLLTVSDLLDILAAALAILYIRKLSTMQSQKHLRGAQPVG